MGEILNRIIPFPIPASIYGLVIMFLALKIGIVKINKVQKTGNFLIDVMPIMFVPPGVAVLETLDVLQSCYIQLIMILIVSTIIVMGVTGVVTQLIINKTKKTK